jgi:5-methylcytosine-specific restriction endonuclease McrA
MLYDYPSAPHARIHGPAGYTDPLSYKDWLRDEFEFRCVYCLARETWYPSGDHEFGVEHILPKSLPEYEHLANVYTNLLYACNRCNRAKGIRILLLDPCRESFSKHMYVESTGEIKWFTIEGQKIVRMLRLNDATRTEFRRKLIALYAASIQNPDC